MAQASTRPSAVTLTTDPKTACAIDFDALVADWDEYLNVAGKTSDVEDEGDGDFDPKSKGHAAQKKRPKPIPSPSGASSGIDLSRRRLTEASLLTIISFLNHLMGWILGCLGDELARELGEGWGIPLEGDMNLAPIENLVSDVDPGMEMDVDDRSYTILNDAIVETHSPAAPMPLTEEAFHESMPPPSLSPATSFSRQLLSQDVEGPKPDIPIESVVGHGEDLKKTKRTRLLLDARTELTDEELKAARSQYLDAQLVLKQNMIQKRSERCNGKVIEDKIWGVPYGIQAQVLINFWVENFKIQVEARSGIISIHPDERRPNKRRKISPVATEEIYDAFPGEAHELQNNLDDAATTGRAGRWRIIIIRAWIRPSTNVLRGQGRRAQSRQPSVGFGFDLGGEKAGSSQKSSLFPWDHAGAANSSSVGNIGFLGSDNMQVDQAEIKLRGSSQSRRESSLVGSQMGSILGGVGLSPATVRADSQGLGEDYVFDVDAAPIGNSATLESQRSELHKITLERNSYNFLEYAKMQNQTLPSATSSLTFDTIVPKAASTRHVAAAAFYHCLVLGTKDLLRFEQPIPYGPITISIV
ncbi:hypothetical protein BD779DRAFT_1666537 [Infundibulicybe gibba]|nr:hypothetical protein BD779DRAFT_1666537 [Infundibulicybe gibba]